MFDIFDLTVIRESEELRGLVLGFAIMGIYWLLWDTVKELYCRWKHKKNNGYRCFYWDCPHWHECQYNGTKRRLFFEKRLFMKK